MSKLVIMVATGPVSKSRIPVTWVGTSTSIRPYGDALLVNLSVWETVDDLKGYSYRSDHLEPFRARKDWFTRPDGPHLVL